MEEYRDRTRVPDLGLDAVGDDRKIFPRDVGNALEKLGTVSFLLAREKGFLRCEQLRAPRVRQAGLEKVYSRGELILKPLFILGVRIHGD